MPSHLNPGPSESSQFEGHLFISEPPGITFLLPMLPRLPAAASLKSYFQMTKIP